MARISAYIPQETLDALMEMAAIRGVTVPALAADLLEGAATPTPSEPEVRLGPKDAEGWPPEAMSPETVGAPPSPPHAPSCGCYPCRAARLYGGGGRPGGASVAARYAALDPALRDEVEGIAQTVYLEASEHRSGVVWQGTILALCADPERRRREFDRGPSVPYPTPGAGVTFP